MAFYRKIDTRLHGDRRFRSLSPLQPSGQGLWMYLLTCPHQTRLPGLISATKEDLASRLRWSLDEFIACFDELESATNDDGLPMARADWDAAVIWIPRAPMYNFPESPNVIRSWTDYFDNIPECSLKSEWLVETRSAVAAHIESNGKSDGYMQAFREAFPQAFGEASPRVRDARRRGRRGDHDHDHELEHEKEHEKEGEHDDEQPATALPPIAFEMPVKGGVEFLFESEVDDWQKLYPAIDVDMKLRKMVGYWRAQPASKRKTPKGIRRSINHWLSGDAERPKTSDGARRRTRRSMGDVLNGGGKEDAD